MRMIEGINEHLGVLVMYRGVTAQMSLAIAHKAVDHALPIPTEDVDLTADTVNWQYYAALLRKERRACGYNQAQAAQRIGKTSQWWSYYENGKSARKATVEKHEQALGITDGRLLIVAGYKKPSVLAVAMPVAKDESAYTPGANAALGPDLTSASPHANAEHFYQIIQQQQTQLDQLSALVSRLTSQEVPRWPEHSPHLSNLSNKDELTGMINLCGFYLRRNAEFERVRLQWEQGVGTPAPLSLLLFEVNHFNSVVLNRHGEAVAEAVLKRIAKMLKLRVYRYYRKKGVGHYEAKRERDCSVARMITPESVSFSNEDANFADYDSRYERDFGVILTNTTFVEAAKFAAEVQDEINRYSWQRIAARYQHRESRYGVASNGTDDIDMSVKISFGIGSYEERSGHMSAASPTSLLKQALADLDDRKYLARKNRLREDDVRIILERLMKKLDVDESEYDQLATHVQSLVTSYVKDGSPGLMKRKVRREVELVLEDFVQQKERELTRADFLRGELKAA
jgi:GGDEF domain-containing protein/DNA-binding XRE family transcriptional regulator